ncbi:hypothetical protein [Sphingobium aromaticiconvertens]|uniref:hypothetical protein n=1 Tax=Sphingobium aromaticiconvertens TaxID=365341 RepID=UPI003019F352
MAVSQIRSFLSGRFGAEARVTQLDVDFDRTPLAVRTVVIAPRSRAESNALLQTDLSDRLGRPVALRVDQVLLDPGAGAVEAQRAELRQANDAVARDIGKANGVAGLVALAAGVAPDAVTIDRDHQRVTATAAILPGAELATYGALERRTANSIEGWQVALVPPISQLPVISFADNIDTLDAPAREAVLLSAWAARRWNSPQLTVPGFQSEMPEKPVLSQRRALAIAALLKQQGITAIAAPPAGQSFRLAVTNQMDR